MIYERPCDTGGALGEESVQLLRANQAIGARMCTQEMRRSCLKFRSSRLPR